MRPARIAVFDGLRVATEHVEHLQDALASSIQDFREVVGVGRVLRGFDVERDGVAAVVVRPGLGFDRAARRLALDEPRRIEVAIPPGREAQYLCIEHETVEDLEVEGRPTLLWDSVAVTLRDVAPGAEDDALALVKLVPAGPDAAAFDLVPLAPAAEEPPRPEPGAGDLAVRQGVLRLPPADLPPVDGVAGLKAAVAERLAAGGETDAPIAIPLAVAELAAEAPAGAATFAVQLTATVGRGDGTVGRLEAVAHGEATFAPAPAARFALSTVRAVPPPHEGGPGGWIASELVEDGIATLPLAPALADAAARELLDGLRLVADVDAASPAGMAVSCALAWGGPVDEGRAVALEEHLTALTWSAAVGWKSQTTGRSHGE